MYSSNFSSFSLEDHSKLRFSERSCFLEDSETNFVPCDTDLEPLATQEVTSAHEPKTALEALSLGPFHLISTPPPPMDEVCLILTP